MRNLTVSGDVCAAFRMDPMGEYIGVFNVRKVLQGQRVGYEIIHANHTHEAVTLETIREMHHVLGTVLFNAERR